MAVIKMKEAKKIEKKEEGFTESRGTPSSCQTLTQLMAMRFVQLGQQRLVFGSEERERFTATFISRQSR